MKRNLNVPKTLIRRPSLIIGSLLLAGLIGVSGCSSSNSTVAQPSTKTQSDQGQTNQGQNGQGQRMRNPAQQAAMEIRRLQNNQQNALTSDQKEKIKPILQELINATNPSQDFLQQKADAINAVLTDQQKSYLAAQRPAKGSNQNSKTQNNNQNNQASGNGNSQSGSRPQGGTSDQQPRGTFNPQEIYQQVLDSLK